MFFLSTTLSAQQTKLLLKDLPQYPVALDLLNGVVIHSDSSSPGLFHFEIIQNNQVLYSQSDSIIIRPGINNLFPDSVRKTQLSFISKRSFIDSTYLMPGDYQVSYKLFIQNNLLQEGTLSLSVPVYDIALATQQDSLHIKTNPGLKHIDLYVSVITQKQKKHKQFNRAVTFLLKDSIIRQQQITDSTAKGESFYQFHVFANGKLLKRFPYSRWSDIGQSNSDQPKDTALLKSNNLFHNKVVAVNGRAAVEYGYSNIRFPNQYSSPQYIRFYFQPTVSVFGVPLSVNTMISSENNNLYPVNTFNIGFNAKMFRQQFAKNSIAYQMEKERSLQNNSFELNQIDKELIKHKIKLNRLKADPSLDDPMEGEKLPGMKKIRRKKRTTTLPNDTLSINYDNANEIALHRKRQIEELESRINNLESKKARLEDLMHKDSVFLRNRDWKSNGNDTIQRFLKKQRFKGLTKTFLSMEKLDIGLTTPYYSALTLAQTPMQGIHTEFVFPQWFVAATYGYGISSYPLLGIRQASSPDFRRQIIGSKIGYGNKNSNSVYLSYHHFNDNRGASSQNVNMLSAPKENDLFSVGGTLRPIQQLMLEGEFVKSLYEPNPLNPAADPLLTFNHLKEQNQNNAFHIKAIGQVTRNATLSGSLKQLGTGYYSIGIPFLRNDYREYELTWRQQYWYRQITTELFYRDNRDNLSGNKTHTTILKGYGAKLQTAFRKWPNLIASYQPFSMQATYQSNLLSTGALPQLITQQFSVLTATIIYKKNIQRSSLYSTATYTRSDNTDQTGYTSGLTTWIWNAQLTSYSKNQFTVTYSFTDPKPYLAMNKMYYGELGWGFRVLRNKLQNQVGCNGQWIADGKNRQGMYYQLGTSVNKLNITARAGLNFLHGNWGVTQETEQTVRVLLEYLF